MGTALTSRKNGRDYGRPERQSAPSSWGGCWCLELPRASELYTELRGQPGFGLSLTAPIPCLVTLNEGLHLSGFLICQEGLLMASS